MFYIPLVESADFDAVYVNFLPTWTYYSCFPVSSEFCVEHCQVKNDICQNAVKTMLMMIYCLREGKMELPMHFQLPYIRERHSGQLTSYFWFVLCKSVAKCTGKNYLSNLLVDGRYTGTFSVNIMECSLELTSPLSCIVECDMTGTFFQPSYIYLEY